MACKLSIQIALHNRDPFIRASLLSALNCGYDDLEIIVFDDASADKSGEIVKELAAEYSGKIRYIHSDKNIGCAVSRAEMANLTEAEYILILDDDDILLPFDIEGQLKFLDENPCFAASYGKLFLTDVSLNPVNSVMGGTFSRFILPYNTPVTHPAAIIRRSDLIAAGNYEVPGIHVKTVAEDLFLWFKLSLKKDLYFDNNFRLVYRQHSLQTTNRTAAYLEAANFIHNTIVERNRALYEMILHGKADVNEDNIKTVILLLAIISRYMPSKDSRRTSVLDAAESVAASDYGVNAVKFEHYLEIGDPERAAAEALKIINRPGADIYTRSLGLEKFLGVCGVLGEDPGKIRELRNMLEKEYARFDFDLSKYLWK